RILLAIPGLDLPSHLAVVGVDPDQVLEQKLLPHLVCALVLLRHRRLESTATEILAGAPQGLDRVNLVKPANRLKVLGHDLVRGLRRGGRGEARHAEERPKSCSHATSPYADFLPKSRSSGIHKATTKLGMVASTTQVKKCR